MLTKVWSVASKGLNPIEVEVEVNVASKGFPAFNIVGLATKAVDEAKERVRTALTNSGIEFPQKKITVNLAPADFKKTGSQYDFAIAIAYLLATQQIKNFSAADKIFVGELSLDGRLRSVNGALNIARLVKKSGLKYLFFPKEFEFLFRRAQTALFRRC